MVKWTIFIAAYTAGCIWLSMRRMEASGTGAMTPRGRLREMGWGLALLALTISLFGLNGVNHWPTLIAILIAGLVLVLLPRQAAWLVAVMLIALGLYGFLLVGAYQRGYSGQKLYGLVLAGAGSYRTEFVQPQAYVFLALGLWLLWRTVNRRSRLVRPLLGRKPWWGLLLLPVAAVAIELAGPDYGFSPGWWSIPWNLAVAAAVLLIVWRFPAVAADLAAAGLIALGLYGIALALFWRGQRPSRDRVAAGHIRRHPGGEQPARRAHHDHHGDTVRAVLTEDLSPLRDVLVRLIEAHDFEIAAAVKDAPGPSLALLEHRCPLS